MSLHLNHDIGDGIRIATITCLSLNINININIYIYTHNRPNVHVEKGRWQDGVARLIVAGKKFDAIFFDTYAEHYRDMQVSVCG